MGWLGGRLLLLWAVLGWCFGLLLLRVFVAFKAMRKHDEAKSSPKEALHKSREPH